MFNRTILLFLFLLSGAIFAQSAPPTAASVLEKTAQKYNALATFSFNFTVTVEAKEKKLHNFEGILLVKKEKYYLTFEDQIIANDGVTMWNYQKNTNEASIFEAEDDEFAMFHPVKMLNGWNKEYTAKVIREDELLKNKVIIVDLTPKKQAAFYKMRLFINKTTSYIQQVVMYELDGTTITYTVSKFAPNPEVDDRQFTFNKNDFLGVEVNDMR